MPNWSYNHTAFIGSEDTINHIARAIDVKEEIFNFDKLYPVPEVFTVCTAPVDVITPQEFAAEYHEPCPKTIEDFTAFAKKYAESNKPYNKKVDNVPKPVYDLIVNTYGCSDWYDWCNKHWGVKWPGFNPQIHHKAANLIVVNYETPWNPPEELFDNLLHDHSDLQIINGSQLESFDGIEITRGTDAAFYAYFHADRDVTLSEPLSTENIDPANIADHLWLDDGIAVSANTDIIEGLLSYNCLVNTDGEIKTIANIIASNKQ